MEEKKDKTQYLFAVINGVNEKYKCSPAMFIKKWSEITYFWTLTFFDFEVRWLEM